MVDPLSGEQFELSAGDFRATIASVGASLRELTWQGRHLVVPFDAHEIRPDYRGARMRPTTAVRSRLLAAASIELAALNARMQR